MKILAIEDDAVFADWCYDLLKGAGVAIEAFVKSPSLKDGLRLAASEKPSLILLDLNLADCRHDRTIPEIPTLDAIAPVIVVSGLGSGGKDIDADVLAKCYENGAVGHIFKMCVHPHCAGLISGILASSAYNWRRIHQ